MRRIPRLFSFKPSKMLVLTAALGLFGLSIGLASQTVHAQQDSNPNSIIWGGFTGSTVQSEAANFISIITNTTKNDGHGHTDLQAVYAHAPTNIPGHSYPGYTGLQSADYSTFASKAVLGEAEKDTNEIVLPNGTVVGTDATSIGRLSSSQSSGYFTEPISVAGKTVNFYGNSNSKAFAQSSIPVMILFNPNGTIKFAVLTSCGNPIYAKSTTAYSCNTLNTPQSVAGSPNTFNFTAKAANVAGGAKVVNYIYDFGDGTKSTPQTSPTTPVKHVYAAPGNYTVKLYVTVSLPGGGTQVTAVTAPCTKVITVPKPVVSCTLTVPMFDNEKRTYSFVTNVMFTNGATFTGGTYDFGDGSTTPGKINGNTLTASHTYAAANKYTITAKVNFNYNGHAYTSAACTAVVSPTAPPVTDCLPGVPQGSSQCQCQYNSSIPASDTVHCVPPAALLVNTGPGDVIGIAAGAAIVGFFLYRQFIYRKKIVATDGAFTAAGMPTISAEESNELVEQVITHQTAHRNAQGLDHASYHKPHRFRPRSHND